VKSSDSEFYKLRVPIKTLGLALDNMADFPYKDPDVTRYVKPTLFVRGTKSHYVPDEALPVIGRFFPRFQIKDIEAGHWVISENPEAFRMGKSSLLPLSLS
jgi:pimeloyl-ACP methyl ester carboxylesterase